MEFSSNLFWTLFSLKLNKMLSLVSSIKLSFVYKQTNEVMTISEIFDGIWHCVNLITNYPQNTHQIYKTLITITMMRGAKISNEKNFWVFLYVETILDNESFDDELWNGDFNFMATLWWVVTLPVLLTYFWGKNYLISFWDIFSFDYTHI